MRISNVFVVASLMVFLCPGSRVRGAEDSLDIKALVKRAVRETIDSQMKAMEKKDIDGAIDSFHSESPYRDANRKILESFLKPFTLKMETQYLEIIGADDTYVYARIKYLTKKVEGPAFRNNINDALWAFRKDGKAWKVWASATLSKTFVDD